MPYLTEYGIVIIADSVGQVVITFYFKLQHNRFIKRLCCADATNSTLPLQVKGIDVHIFMHACIHSSIHPCIHLYIHPCIHASIRSTIPNNNDQSLVFNSLLLHLRTQIKCTGVMSCCGWAYTSLARCCMGTWQNCYRCLCQYLPLGITFLFFTFVLYLFCAFQLWDFAGSFM